MPLQLDLTQRVVNVNWGEVTGFLYSGADGMFGSEDGQDWTKAEASVPATSLAFVDDVWVACGPDGCWRSEDGATTWEAASAPAFMEVAAMKPSSDTDTDNPEEPAGVFAGWLEDDAGDNLLVYTSHDLGKTWGLALTIRTDGGHADGFEGIRGLSGCGGALFVCSIYQSSPYHHGDGNIYSSLDGHTFSKQTVFGHGNETLPDDPNQYPRIGFGANAVGYDAKTKTYIAIGGKEIIPEFGTQESYLIYSTSNSPSFSLSEGTVAISAVQTTTGGGEFISVANSAAGGDGKHVAGLSHFQFAVGGAFISGSLQACFIPPGSPDTLEPMGTTPGGFVGSFCFNPDVEEEDTDGEPAGGGAFACVAFDSSMSGGVYVDSGTSGHFEKTHSGRGIDIGGAPGGAVAVGTIEFL